jgi:perosamine synthetase
MSDIHAALGLAQLERIDEILTARAKVARLYSELLSGCDLLHLPLEQPDMKRSWFVYVIQLQGPSASILRNGLQAHLQSKGISCQVYFPPIHRQPYFQQLYDGPIPILPNTDQAFDSCLALPFSSRLSPNEVRFVCDEVARALELSERVSLPDPTESAPAVVVRT